jgi:hypothetical protein
MKPVRFSVLALGLALVAAAAQAQLKPSTRTDAQGGKPPATAQAPAPAQPARPEGAISNPEIEKAGQTAAHAWLLLLDRKDWGTAWDASSSVFRQSVPLPAWMDGIPKLRDPFGAFVERQPLEAIYKKTLAGRPDGDYVTVVFASKFANQERVQETVTTVRDTDGRWRVTGYTAR